MCSGFPLHEYNFFWKKKVQKTKIPSILNRIRFRFVSKRIAKRKTRPVLEKRSVYAKSSNGEMKNWKLNVKNKNCLFPVCAIYVDVHCDSACDQIKRKSE